MALVGCEHGHRQEKWWERDCRGLAPRGLRPRYLGVGKIRGETAGFAASEAQTAERGNWELGMIPAVSQYLDHLSCERVPLHEMR